MLRLFKSKLFLLLLATVVILVFIGVSSKEGSKLNSAGNIISVPFSPLQRAFSVAGQKVQSFFGFFKDTKATQQENDELKIKLTQLEKENKELIGLREKNKELRDALNLKDQFEAYDLFGANVIGKDPGNWFNVFRIDVGSKDKIAENYPVLTSNKGLVGRISQPDLTSSKVISIIDEDSVVSGWISKPGGGHVIVRGDLELKEQGLCRIDYIPLDVDVTVNDIIETSGLGGIYPKGILIGKVKEVRKAGSEMNRYAIIEPAVDFKKLEEVFVLRNKNNVAGTGSVTK